MSEEQKKVVVPGEILAESMEVLPGFGTYRNEKKIIASRLGLLSQEGKVIKIIPLSGKYLPQRNDIVIGQVFDILISGWRLEINSPYSAMLSMKEASHDFINKGADLTRYYNLEDYVVAKIVNVTSQNLIDVSMRGPGLKKLKGGRIIKINPFKVPRIIGKKGSMVSMIKNATGCKIVVGQNGLVWIQGDPAMEIIAIQTITKIEQESHLNGLTEKIKTYLEQHGLTVVKEESHDEQHDDHSGHEHRQDDQYGEQHDEQKGEEYEEN
ncbi:RNA-binding protein [Candidatus Woesearchaeota archaeon]|nr:MAG: RNA-binding protein [Candidatus Woesearchaeota archaeon]